MEFKKPGELRVPKNSIDSALISPSFPDRAAGFRNSCSLEAPGSPQAMTPTYDTRRKLSIIGKTSPFSTCIPAIELSSTQVPGPLQLRLAVHTYVRNLSIVMRSQRS
jgi:hypothetical protein